MRYSFMHEFLHAKIYNGLQKVHENGKDMFILVKEIHA